MPGNQEPARWGGMVRPTVGSLAALMTLPWGSGSNTALPFPKTLLPKRRFLRQENLNPRPGCQSLELSHGLPGVSPGAG